MPTLNDIRTHIQSVQQTRKITNAMYLISSSRMRKAMRNIEQNRAYFSRAVDTMSQIRVRVNLRHPYLMHRNRQGQNRTAYVVIAGEKGLSGSYNHDVLRMADRSMQMHAPVRIFTVGEMAASHFKRRERPVDESFRHVGQAPSIQTARRLAHILMKLYDDQVIDEVRFVYTRFVSAMVHVPIDVEILPIELDDFGSTLTQIKTEGEILYDPSPEAVFHALVPQFMIGYIYGALVHAYASENFARMTAMEGATQSADEMIEHLTRQYHAARQVAITNELTEIISTADVLKN